MRGIFTKGLLAALCLGIAAPSANAYTVDEIIANGEWMTATYKYLNEQTNFYGLLISPYEEEGLHFEKVDNTHIKISGFSGGLSFIFTLGESRLLNVNYVAHSTVEATDGDGDCLYLNAVSAPVDETHLCGKKSWRIMPVPYDTDRNYKNDSDGKIILMIKEDRDGTLYFEEEEDFYGCTMAMNSATPATSYNSIIDKFVIRPFEEYNSWCTDELHNFNANFEYTLGWDAYWQITDYWVEDTNERTYPVYVNLDFDNNTFSIRNFSKRGQARDNTTNNRGDLDRGYLGNPFDIKGVILPDENKLRFDANQYACWALLNTDAYMDNFNWFPYYLRYVNEKDIQETHDYLYATYSVENEGKPVHNTKHIEHGWVTNHGKRVTYEGAMIEIEPYVYSNLEIIPQIWKGMPWGDSYTNTKIYERDCTLDVDLNLDRVEWDSQNQVAHVEASIVTKKNDKHVDHYDIMVVGGHYDYIDDKGFLIDHEAGFERAKMIPESAKVAGTETTLSRASEVGTHDYKIDHWFGKDFMQDHHNTDGKFTFFIRANYKPETLLTPTFHSLQYIDRPIPTGIETVGTDIEKPEDNTIYDLFGRRVVNPQHGTLYIIGGKKVIY